MGNSQSSSLFGPANTNDAVVNLYRKYATGCSVSGGAELNLESLKDYPNSMMSLAKQQLIRDIAADLASELRIPGLNPTNKNISEIVAELKKVVPDPRPGGNKKSWSAKEPSQLAACKVMAQIINRRMKETVIDETAKPADVCEQVGEIMYSLFTGMQAEFIGVKTQVEHSMKNIKLLIDLLEQQHRDIDDAFNNLGSGDDVQAKQDMFHLHEAHEDVMKELNHQMGVLQNILDVIIKPTDAALLEAFKDITQLKDLGKKLRQFPGTSQFGTKVSYAISGFATAASAAKIVDDALKYIGIKLAEFEKAKTNKDLRKLTSDALMRILPTATTEQLKNYEAATEFLNSVMYMHDDIVAELKKRGAGDITGAGEVAGGGKIDKRIKVRKQVREILLYEFGKRLIQLISGILLSAQSISRQVGSGALTLTDSLENIPKVLEQLPNYQTGSLSALSGYHDDIKSRQDRESYLSILRMIIAALDDAIKDHPNASQFKDMRRGFDDIIKLIELFASRFKDEHGVVGSAQGGDEIAGGEEMTRVAFQFSTLKDTITYAFRTARIRINLAKIAKENAESAKEYEKVTADAIAGAVDVLTREKTDLLNRIAGASDATNALNGLFTALRAAAPANQNADEYAKTELNNLMSPRLNRYETKISMLRTAEAVDRYMMNFADGIAGDVDSMSNIMNILNNAEVISQWYTNKSGDKLCQVFDAFPASYVGNAAVKPSLNAAATNTNINTAHYYLRVASLCRIGEFASVAADHPGYMHGAAGNWTNWEGAVGATAAAAIDGAPGHPTLPGSPLLGLPLPEIPKIIELITKFMNVSMLKNIVSVFVTVGSKFSNVDIATKSQFNAAAVYKELNKYIIKSACAFELLATDGTEDTRDINLGALNLPADIRPADSSYVQDDRFGAPQGVLRAGICGTVNLGAATPANLVTREKTFAMRSVDSSRVYADTGANKTGTPFKDLYSAQTDVLFTLIIKSMVAKVLTAVGVFNMFQRPVQENALGYNSMLRQVLGGAPSDPKVIPEALELYIRLPLLAEFYRKVLPFEENQNNITMVPEIEGVFSDLITVIFDDARNVKDGSYSLQSMQAMVDAINKIYLAFKDRKNPVTDAIQEFVAEINRRIGIYSASERTAWWTDRRGRYTEDYQREDPDDVTNFELSTIDESDTSTGQHQPSERYENTWYTQGRPGGMNAPKHKYDLDLTQHRRFLNDLRHAIDTMFIKAQGNDAKNIDNVNTKFTFAHIIDARQAELKHATTDEERFRIVNSAISSLGQFSSSALEKSYLLFHEKVVAPLAVLQGMYKLLSGFHGNLNNLYILVRRFRAWLATAQPRLCAAGTQVGQPAGAAGNTGILNSNHPDWATLYSKFAHNQDANGGVLMAPTDNCLVVRTGSQGSEIIAAAAAAGTDNIRHGLTYGQLKDINANGHLDSADGKKFLERFALDQNKIMIELLELLYGHTSSLDDLVHLRIDSNQDLAAGSTNVQVGLDHSNMRKMIFSLFDDVKASIDKFRGLLPKEVIAPYEAFDANSTRSLYSLERHLIDELLNGKRSAVGGLANLGMPAELSPDDSIEKSGEKVKYVLDFLTTPWKFNARGAAAAGAVGGALPGDAFTSLRRLTENATVGANAALETAGISHEFNDALNSLIAYSLEADAPVLYAAVPGVGVPAGAGPRTRITQAAHGNTLLGLLFNTTGKTVNNIAVGGEYFPLTAGIRDGMIDFQYGFTNNSNKGVFFLFNQLVYAYVSQMFDQSTNRIYVNTISEFANSEFSAAISGGNNYNNTQTWLTNNIAASAPANEANGVLLRSTALILRQLMNERTVNTDAKRFLELNLSEVPLYVKEKMRAQLPIFNKLFRYLIKRCDILKFFVHVLNVEQVCDKGALFNVSYPGGLPSAVHQTRAENEGIMMNILDRIIQGCSVLVSCINNVQKELADSPKYLETHANSIAEFESLNGKQPFMPPSSMLYWLRRNNVPRDIIDSIQNGYAPLPFFSLGDTRFKLEYGTRGLLSHNKTTLADAPGYVRIIRDHNSASDSRYHFSDSDSVAWDAYISLIRYMIDSTIYRGGIFSMARNVRPDAPVAASLRYGYVADTDLVDAQHKGTVYSLKTDVSLQLLMRLTESSNVRESKAKLVDVVERANNARVGTDREDMIIFNIIDLNLVPINFNALRREIPLVHLYNYSYTFDRYVSEILNVKDEEVDEHAARTANKYATHGATGEFWDMPREAIDGSRDGKVLLGRLLINPYMQIDLADYEYRVAKIMRGNLGVEGLDRPKFLSDVIYQGALFGELYSDAHDVEEGGPAVGDGAAHGRQGVAYGLSYKNNYFRDLMVEVVTNALIHLFGVGAGGAQHVVPIGSRAAIKSAVQRTANKLYLPDGTHQASHTANTFTALATAAAGDFVQPAGNAFNATLAGVALAGPALDDFNKTISAVAILLMELFAQYDPILANINVLRKSTLAEIQAALCAVDRADLVFTLLQVFAVVFTNAPGGANYLSNPGAPAGTAAAQQIGANLGLIAAAPLMPLVNIRTTNLSRDGVALVNARPAGDISKDRLTELSRVIHEMVKDYHLQYSRAGRNAIEAANPRFFSNKLHYIETDADTGEGTLKSVELAANYKQVLQRIGKVRFDTYLVRNVFWLANLQRIIRLSMSRSLHWYDEKIVTKHAVTSTSITELHGSNGNVLPGR